MKICYIADAGDIHTQKWVTYFANKGHEVHLISFRPLSDPITGVHLHILKELCGKIKLCKYTVNALFVFIQINKLLKQICPDIIHGHSIRDHTIITALTGFRPFVTTAWGSDVLIYPNESVIMKYAVPFTLKKADIITSDGENTKEAMIKMGIEPEKIRVIMFGVDTKKFIAGAKKCGSPTVVSTRRLGVVHDVETLIKAIPLILEKIPDAKFIIVGEGEQKEYLIALAESLGVLEATRFVGYVPNDELPVCLSSSDVYVSTSLSDSGLSAGTSEAMACGLPVVITDFGDNRKWIDKEYQDFVVIVKDPKVLAEKIIYLLKHEDIRKEFGLKNRKIIEDRNNYRKEMEKMENIYIELVERYKT